MTRIANITRSAWNRSQCFAVFALCVGASMALPLTLATIGFHTL